MNSPAPQAAPAERRRLQARARRLARRVETLIRVGRVEEAIACQSEVVALRPEDATAFLRLGLLYREANHFDRALSALRRASSLDPAGRDLREALVETLVEAGQYEEAVVEGRSLVKASPRSLSARDVLSMAYLQLGRIDKALQVTSEMVGLDPLNPSHHFRRGVLYQQQGNCKDAVQEYSRAIDMAHPESETGFDAGQALDALDEYQMRQIMLLATEDRLFGLLLRRDPEEAIGERGFFLSEDGLARLHHLADAHLPEILSQPSSSAAWGGVAYYN